MLLINSAWSWSDEPIHELVGLKQPLNMHAQLYSGSSGLNFGMNLHRRPDFVRVKEANTLTMLHGCAGSSEPSLHAYAIRKNILMNWF